MLLVACTTLFVSAYLKAGHRVAVLVVSRNVPAGAPVTAAELQGVQMAVSPGFTPIPVADLAKVVGQRAAVPLVAGELLVPGVLTHGSAVPAGDAVVGVTLKPGQLPADGVSAGETVDVVLTGPPGSPAVAAGAPSASASGLGAPSLAGTILAPAVMVSGVTLPTGNVGNDITAVSLLVPHPLAPAIASASAAGQVALVVVPTPSVPKAPGGPAGPGASPSGAAVGVPAS